MSFLDIFWGILQGLSVTLTVTFYGLCFAVPFALMAGTLQRFLTGPAYGTVTLVIEFWRATPIIVLMFMFYYSLPAAGIYLSATTVAAMTLGLHVGAYGSQSVRAALQALDHGQVEAGLALGIRRPVVFFTIELPQMVMATLPTFVNLFIQLLKDTALVALITMTDMTERAKEISQLTFDPLRIYSALLLAYFMLLYPTTVLGRRLERAVSLRFGRRLTGHVSDA